MLHFIMRKLLVNDAIQMCRKGQLFLNLRLSLYLNTIIQQNSLHDLT